MKESILNARRGPASARFALVAMLAVLTASAGAQEVLFFDDFSGGLPQWTELGNPGIPGIVDGELNLGQGYAPNWFVTTESFDFGSEALRVDMDFTEGGHQESANFKRIYMQPLFGATDPDANNGGVMANFNYTDFSMLRRTAGDDGAMSWETIPMADGGVPPLVPGVRIKVAIEPDGMNGSFYINGVLAGNFIYQGETALEGGVGFRSVVQRNLRIDDFRFYQTAADGTEEVILEDDFNRQDIGSNWVNETLAEDSAPGPLDVHIENGELYIVNDGTGDTWVRTAQAVAFAGKTTVMEYTFVDYVGDVVYAPSAVIGTKPYVAGETSGVILLDNGPGFNYGMVNGGWAGGQAAALGGVRNGMHFKIVVDPGGQSGTCYRDGIQSSRWYVLGPPLHGGIAFRSIVDRDATIDDLRIYSIDDAGNETTLYENDFNADELDADWIVEAITPGGTPDGLWAFTIDDDDDGDNELFIDHDGSMNDSWLRLDREIPFAGDKTVVFEGTFVFIPNGYPTVAIGTSQWVAGETIGPLLLDNIETPWLMDTRGGNVWLGGGPFPGTTISVAVNADGVSGTFYCNDIPIKDWVFAEGEAPIPAGAVGIRDPFDAPQANAEGFEPEFAYAAYDNVRVTRLAGTPVENWMIH